MAQLFWHAALLWGAGRLCHVTVSGPEVDDMPPWGLVGSAMSLWVRWCDAMCPWGLVGRVMRSWRDEANAMRAYGGWQAMPCDPGGLCYAILVIG